MTRSIAKMSKSLGNGIDPLDVIARFGADPLRYTVVAGMGLGVDIIFDPDDLEKSFATGRNFVTKLWNIGRFLLSNVGTAPVHTLSEIDPDRLSRADEWVLARLDAAIAECDAALGPARPNGGHWSVQERTTGLRLNDYAETARRFVWNELADWYLEAVKARLAEPGDDREVARAVLVHAFDGALRLLHPIVPFVTEALWQRLPGRVDDELLVTARWPVVAGGHGPGAAEFELVRDAVGALRQLRGEYNISPGKQLAAFIVPAPNARAVATAEAPLIGRLAKCSVSVVDSVPTGEAAAHQVLGDGSEVILPLAGTIDVAKECARLKDELASLEKQLNALRQRLAQRELRVASQAGDRRGGAAEGARVVGATGTARGEGEDAVRRLILLIAVAGCAQQGAPPGGPEDRNPPHLLRISPDTNAMNARPRNVELRFDEIVNERPARGGQDLSALFLSSPSTRARRRAVAPKPHRDSSAPRLGA